MSESVAIKVTLDAKTAERVRAVAEGIGLTPTAVCKVMMKRFADTGGFPFDVSAPLHLSYEGPGVDRAGLRDGVAVLPASWDEGDDDDDELL